jgi:hypothetical protein
MNQSGKRVSRRNRSVCNTAIDTRITAITGKTGVIMSFAFSDVYVERFLHALLTGSARTVRDGSGAE